MSAQRLDRGGKPRELYVDGLPARDLGPDPGQEASPLVEDEVEARLDVVVRRRCRRGTWGGSRRSGAHAPDRRWAIARSGLDPVAAGSTAGNVGAMVAPVRPTDRVFPAQPMRALVTMLALTALLWVIELYDLATGEQLDADGIVPRTTDGLDGVLWAPLLHGGFAHLVANTLPFFVFGFLVLAAGLGQFLLVTAGVWGGGGLGVWLTAPDGSVTVGMSGVIFGWLVFLLVRGFFVGSGKQILLAVGLFFVWGGILLGVLPGQPGVSWQGHLFGALAGLLAAWLVTRRRARQPR